MMLGVFFFSYISGSVTSIITHNEKIQSRLAEKTLLLNKIHKDYQLPSMVYYQILTIIKHDNK
jgi:hypothetical protein